VRKLCIKSRISAGAALVLALAACDCRGKPGEEDPDGVAIGGWYRAEIRSDEGAVVPFFISLPADHGAASARIVNGHQEIEAQHVWSGLRLDVEFPLFHTHIEAVARADGVLEGSFHHESLAFGDSELTFTAAPIDEPDPEARFSSSDASPSGELFPRWRLTFDDTGDAELRLEARGDTAIDGVLRLDNGNAIYLAGNRRGSVLRLSAFDGSSLYLLDATIAGERLEATWRAGPGLSWRERVTAVADADFEIDIAVALAPGVFRLPVPELREPPYQGAPVILALTGTFNPASMRAIPLLDELHDAHRDADLQILALNYELTADERHNDEVAAAIAEAYEVEWRILPIDGRAEDYLSIVPAGLEHLDVQSFPVLAFIDRQGLVHALRAGFPPEAAAELYAQVVEDYRRLAAEIAAPAADDRDR
jgi:thiol-disulfide isomerase/thioredoxin